MLLELDYTVHGCTVALKGPFVETFISYLGSVAARRVFGRNDVRPLLFLGDVVKDQLGLVAGHAHRHLIALVALQRVLLHPFPHPPHGRSGLALEWDAKLDPFTGLDLDVAKTSRIETSRN